MVYSRDPSKNAETKVGVIVHILNQGLVIEKRLLLKVLPYIQVMLDDERYLRGWRDPASRRANLEAERHQIEWAIEHDGRGMRKHVAGLLERIVTGISG
jgi:hypothetical protein